jgi:hypothetical protein
MEKKEYGETTGDTVETVSNTDSGQVLETKYACKSA